MSPLRPPNVPSGSSEGSEPAHTLLSAVRVGDRQTLDRSRMLLLSGWVALALETLLLYATSLRSNFIGDDWGLLAQARGGFLEDFALGTNYHYNPIALALRTLMLDLFGINYVAYHIVILVLFWAGAGLVMQLAFRLTARPGAGVLAGVLFIGFGTQYEAAIWSVVAFDQVPALIVALAGMLAYIASHDTSNTAQQREWAYRGFMAALVLTPFIYEPAITLAAAAVLYDVFVVEAEQGWTPANLLRRARGWIREFWAPGLFLVLYLVLKLWIGHQTSATQAPGLSQTFGNFSLWISIGVLQAFVPGVGLSRLEQLVLMPYGLRLHYIVLAAEMAIVAVVLVRARPLYRFLVAWALAMVVTMIAALGEIQSRHLLLITVPAAILFAWLLAALADHASRFARQSSLMPQAGTVARYGAPGIVIVAFVVFGAKCAIAEQQDWNTAIALQNRVVSEIEQAANANPSAKTLYLVDLPDIGKTRYGDLAYIFRNSPPSIITFTLPNRFARVRAITTSQKASVWQLSYAPYAPQAQLVKWSTSPNTIMLVYDAATSQMDPWTPTTQATANNAP